MVKGNIPSGSEETLALQALRKVEHFLFHLPHGLSCQLYEYIPEVLNQDALQKCYYSQANIIKYNWLHSFQSD